MDKVTRRNALKGAAAAAVVALGSDADAKSVDLNQSHHESRVSEDGNYRIDCSYNGKPPFRVVLKHNGDLHR